jgi:hypothetical protein
MTENMATVSCDHCGDRLYVEGVREPHYVHHQTGLVFCVTTYATHNGRRTPPDNGSEVER